MDQEDLQVFLEQLVYQEKTVLLDPQAQLELLVSQVKMGRLEFQV